ncbi:properdin-like [Argonauta hians]
MLVTRQSCIWFILGFTLIHMVLQLDGSVVCYKKFRKRRGVCKRPLKRPVYSTALDCCRGRGSGWTRKVHKVGKNSYQCESCEVWKKFPLPSSNEVRPTLAPWGEWTDCTVTCGAGWRSKYRQCSDCNADDYRNHHFEPCMMRSYCPVDGNWGPWYQWDQCTKSCGGGHRSRTRSCIYPPPANGGKDCIGSSVDKAECNTKPCPVNGGWSNWLPWTTCSVSCGTGMTRRVRTCTNPSPKHRGRQCGGGRSQVKKCFKVKCQQNGGWSLWSSWTPCPVTCGTAYRIRNRECNSPKPQRGGKYCRGVKTQKLECRGRRPCPVSIHGSWSNWSEFGSCNARRCSGIRGFKTRHRTCSKPKPRHFGRPCRGRAMEKRECYNNIDCPVNGKWCAWSHWHRCTLEECTSATATESRVRKCSCPKPQNNGVSCPEGPDEEIRPCGVRPFCKKLVAANKRKTSRPLNTTITATTITTTVRYPQSSSSQQYPIISSSQRYPIISSSQRYPISTSSQRYPISTSSQRYPISFTTLYNITSVRPDAISPSQSTLLNSSTLKP